MNKKVLFFLFSLNALLALWVQTNINPTLPSDLNIYVTAGQRALHNGYVYHPFELGRSFIYPPTALLIFAPLPFLGPFQQIWAGINILCMLLVVFVTSRSLPNRIPNREVIWLAAAALLYAPFWEQITIGQVNSLVLLGMVLQMLGISDSRYKWLGDLGLAVAIAVKISPLILVALPLLNRDWERCIRIFAYLLMMIVCSVAFFGLAPWLDFFEILPKLLHGYTGINNQTITPSLTWLIGRFSPYPADISWTSALFPFIILAGWVGTVAFRTHSSNQAALLMFGIIGMTISSSLIWYHHLVFLLAPIIFLLFAIDTKTSMGKICVLLLISGVLLINSDRLIEAMFMIPALASIVGYMAIYIASALSIYLPSLLLPPCNKFRVQHEPDKMISTS